MARVQIDERDKEPTRFYRITGQTISYGGFIWGFRDYGPPQGPRGIVDL